MRRNDGRSSCGLGGDEVVALEVIVGVRVIEIGGDTRRNFKTKNTIWQKGQDGIARHTAMRAQLF